MRNLLGSTRTAHSVSTMPSGRDILTLTWPGLVRPFRHSIAAAGQNGDDLRRPQNAWITGVVECHQTETSGACYGWIMVERSRRNAVSFDARFGPRRQALTPKPRSSVAISSSPPISRHGCPALRTIGTGD